MAGTKNDLFMVHARPFRRDIAAPIDVWLASEHVSVAERFGSFLTFDGGDDSVDMGDVLDVGVNEFFAITVRFRTTTNQDAILVGKGLPGAQQADGGTGYFVGLGAGGNVRCGVSDGTRTDISAPGPYNDGEWHTATIESSQSGGDRSITLFFDGTQVNQNVNAATDSLSNDDQFRIGIGSTGLDPFDGDVERVVYFASGTQSEREPFIDEPLIADLLPSNTNPDVDGAWQMTAGSGTQLDDQSGNEFHGELEGVIAGPAIWTSAPPPGVVPGVLMSPHSVRASILSGNNPSTSGLPSFGDVVYANPDGRFDEHLTYSWHRRTFETRKGFQGDAWADMDVLFAAHSDDVRGDRDTITVPLIGLDDILRQPLPHLTTVAGQREISRLFEPGFEPYFRADGVDDWIDFGDNLDRGTQNFSFGVAFRTSAALATQGLYTKKPSLGGTGAGYSLGLGSGGAIRVDIADGVTDISVTHTPAGGYNSGERISLVGEVNRTGDTLTLFVNLNDGSGWQNVGNSSIPALFGSLNNALILSAGSTNGASNFLDGEIERLCQQSGAGGPGNNTTDCQAALDERFSEDFDANNPPSGNAMDHYVPLSENTGLTAGDESGSGFSGTINGHGTNIDTPWSGFRNGTKELEGKRMPFAAGVSPNVTPVLLDPIKLVYIVSDGTLSNQFVSVLGVLEGGAVIQEDTATGGSIWTNPPASGEFRTTIEGDLGTLFRLSNEPSLGVTATVTDGDENSDDVLFQLFRRTQAIGMSSQTRSDFLADTGGKPVGVYTTDASTTVLRLVEQILGSWGYAISLNPRDFLGTGTSDVVLIKFEDVAAEIPVATLQLDPVDGVSEIENLRFERQGLSTPYVEVVARFRRFQGFQPISQLSALVGLDIRQQLATEWRQTAVDKTHPDYTGADPDDLNTDEVLTFDSALNHQSNTSLVRQFAVEEALRRLALFAQAPEVWDATLTERQFEFWLGDVIEIVGSRFGFENGKKFIVAGIDDDADASGSRLTLWGGFDSA